MNFTEADEFFVTLNATSHKHMADQLMKAAVRNANIRAEWALAGDERRMEIDRERTAAHEAFMDCCNILSRAMARSGEDNGWRAKLGDDRKAIGDLACHIHCLLSLSAR